jgi:arginine-tRNA-protein transferase
MTHAAPCPYLPGRHEQKIFAELSGENAETMNHMLARVGFRRSQNTAYRPNCVGCNACVSVRVLAQEFQPNATQKRLLRRNADLVVSADPAWATEEQFALLQTYLKARHSDGAMVDMDEFDYEEMVENSPVDTYMIEYREPAEAGRPGRLIGVCITDKLVDGCSMVYSFYDPHAANRKGLGTMIILDHILRMAAEGLPYVYLGYWVEGAPRMAYKTRFGPLERFDGLKWQRMNSSL